ncbi:hypothetical protein GCM10007092_07350 [Thermus composti]|uniref:Uma2 family endonuclease n=1 Tax=Thermus composti TaxID=532059 RepID=A0ABV6Q2N4_9DEIN|nr:Uma2 family endonuclease [Thermus composti]GGM96301.1 hypothetical protein GCM10007092_07350 [Thermus composti]
MIRHRFSAEDFHKMAEAGILGEDDRVELIRGEVVELSPIGKRHAYVVNALVDLLSSLAGRAVLSVQNPLVLSPDTEVYPDLVLLKPPRNQYRDRLPEGKDALLVVEVAETSLRYDLEVKLPLYAKAGIPEVWVVDLEGKRVLVHRKPEGGAYREVETLGPGARLSFLGVEIPAEELL